MLGQLVILSLFVSGAIFTMFYPIFLPENFVDGLKAILIPMFAFNGILPVQLFFTVLF